MDYRENPNMMPRSTTPRTNVVNGIDFSNIAGKPISSGFGRIDKPGARTSHLGGADASYDTYGKPGSPVTAFGSGKVSRVESKGKGRQGNFVDVDYGKGVTIRYYHLADSKATVGQMVDSKSVIGTMGASGYSPSGAHTSYKFFKGGKVVPGLTAFPTGKFATNIWGKQGGGSWSDYKSFDPKTETFDGAKPASAPKTTGVSLGNVVSSNKGVNLGSSSSTLGSARIY